MTTELGNTIFINKNFAERRKEKTVRNIRFSINFFVILQMTRQLFAFMDFYLHFYMKII